MGEWYQKRVSDVGIELLERLDRGIANFFCRVLEQFDDLRMQQSLHQQKRMRVSSHFSHFIASAH
jgi:hypothetical protein